jgi:hypothetical protein
VGHFEDGRLRYAGKVGTGFDRPLLRSLGQQLRALRRDDSPFSDAIRERAVTWVEPELVAQIGFAEWTGDGRLRHPRFLGCGRTRPPATWCAKFDHISSGYTMRGEPACAPKPVARPLGSSHSSWRPSAVRSRNGPT